MLFTPGCAAATPIPTLREGLLWEEELELIHLAIPKCSSQMPSQRSLCYWQHWMTFDHAS